MATRLVVIFSLLLVLLSVSLVFAQSGLLPNGDFSSGLSHWYKGGYGAIGYVTASEGHNALGAYVPSYSVLYSVPFRGSSSYSLWMKKTACASTSAGVYNWSLSSWVLQVFEANCDVWGWRQYTVDLSSFSPSHWLSVYIFYENGSGVFYDDVFVSGGELYYLTEYINGRFDDLSYWMMRDYCGPFLVDSGVGNPPPSVRGEKTCHNTLISMPLYITSQSWTVDLRCENPRNDVALYVSYSGVWSLVTNLSCGSTWTRNDVSLSDHIGRYASIVISYGGNGGYVWIDNVCPSSGCMFGFPTPTPSVATSTLPSYPTIDWSRFPTFPPYPTFPPFPTQVPYPTPVYGVGTPLPITGSVSITGLVRIDDVTPVRVKIDDSTPIAVKVDDRTPVRVSFGDAPNFTPVHWQSAGVSSNPPSSGSVLPTLVTDPAQSHIQYGQGGSAINPVNLQFGQADLSLVLPAIPGVTDSFGVLIHYVYPLAFVIANIDILPGLYGLAAVYVVVFIIRQLQEK